MIDNHPSYHQSITSQEAERRLKLFARDSCHLTRYSKTQWCYVLSIYRKQKPEAVIEHLEIVIDDNGKHKIKGKEEDECFDNIGSLLTYYESNRISPSFPTIGQRYTEEDFNQLARRRMRNCTIL